MARVRVPDSRSDHEYFSDSGIILHVVTIIIMSLYAYIHTTCCRCHYICTHAMTILIIITMVTICTYTIATTSLHACTVVIMVTITYVVTYIHVSLHIYVCVYTIKDQAEKSINNFRIINIHIYNYIIIYRHHS